jgi:hypothetical protein
MLVRKVKMLGIAPNLEMQEARPEADATGMVFVDSFALPIACSFAESYPSN